MRRRRPRRVFSLVLSLLWLLSFCGVHELHTCHSPACGEREAPKLENDLHDGTPHRAGHAECLACRFLSSSQSTPSADHALWFAAPSSSVVPHETWSYPRAVAILSHRPRGPPHLA